MTNCRFRDSFSSAATSEIVFVKFRRTQIVFVRTLLDDEMNTVQLTK